MPSPLVIIVLLFTGCLSFAGKERNPLKGKRLLLMPIDLPLMVMVTRNSSGEVVGAHGSGVEIIQWLSEFLGFEYDLSPDFVKNYDNSSAGRGAKSYLMSGEIDMILTAIVFTAERYKQFDFPYPWMSSSYNLMIPFPEITLNIGAPWEPFDKEVWILIIISAIVLFLSLIFVSRWMTSVDRNNFFARYQPATEYIIGVFFAQGGVCYPTANKIRFIAAVWCLAAFVLTSIYNTVLISYVTSPNYKPLVRSIFDIPKTPGVQIVVDEKMAADITISSAQSGILKELGDMLRRDPTLRCPVAQQCLEAVQSGSRVYIQSNIVEKFYVGENLKSQGKCSFTLTRDGFLFFYASYTLPKNSPYTDWFSRGIIRLHETGLPKLWESWFVQNPARCLNYAGQTPSKPRLSMKHLSSAFILLFAGYVLSGIVFLFERMRSGYKISNNRHI